jgi:DNA-binding NarL/FixJ family response regulator
MPIILLTESQDSDFQQRAIKLGARGRVAKNQTPEILFKAIQKVHAGEVWFERVIMATVLGEMSRQNEAARIETLSKREREVVVLIGEGLKNKQIADRLFISETTVQHHLSSIFGKLGVADRLELVIYAYRQGLVKLPSEFKRKG